MANIEYGSDITFTDWAHGFVDSSSANNWNLYRVDKQDWGTQRYQTVADSSFPTGSAIKTIGSGGGDHPYIAFGDGIPPSLPGLKSTSFTYSIWIKYLNTNWDSNSNMNGYNGIFNISSSGNYRGKYTMGFYGANETIVHVNYGSYGKDYRLTSYTLPNSETKRTWHHYAVTNDKSKIYFFVDGKLIYSEVSTDPGTFDFQFLRSYAEDYYINDYYIMKDICLWTEDFEAPDIPLYEKYRMTNIGGSGWVPPLPKPPVTNILKVY